MIYAKSATYRLPKNRSRIGFKYLDRRKSALIVLIPGWATDYRIFDNLDLKFNYLLPINFSPLTFEKSLLEAMKENNITKISLLGWSLGGFVAAEFTSKYPNLVDELVLVSIREKYKRKELVEIEELLKKNKKGYLYKFYTQCFHRREEMAWFRKNLFKTYCEEFDLNYLITPLDYLKKSRIKPRLLKEIDRITIVHGRHDKIAPIQEAVAIKKRLSHARFVIIENAAHMPFLKEEFNTRIWSAKR